MRIIPVLCLLALSGCNSEVERRKHVDDLQKVATGMHIQEVRSIMGQPDSIFRWDIDDSNTVRMMYYAPFGMSDNIYIFLDNRDSIVSGINDGS